MRKRKSRRPSMTTIAAAALLHFPQLDRDGRPVVDGFGRLVPIFTIDEVREMTAHQFVSLFEMDHDIYETWGGPNVWWNYTPRLIAKHREKTKRDLKIIAKARTAKKKRELPQAVNDLAELNSKLDELPKKRPDRRKRQWPKRTFKQQREWRTSRA